MKRLLLVLALVVSCSNENPNAPRVSKDPISARGIAKVAAGTGNAAPIGVAGIAIASRYGRSHLVDR